MNFRGRASRLSDHCSEVTPSRRDCSANSDPIMPTTIAANAHPSSIRGSFFEGCEVNMPKPSETRALNAPMIQSSCTGVRRSRRLPMRGSLSLVHWLKGYFASRTTPMQTKMAASQRRWSTFSRRKIRAAAALPM